MHPQTRTPIKSILRNYLVPFEISTIANNYYSTNVRAKLILFILLFQTNWHIEILLRIMLLKFEIIIIKGKVI